MNPIIEKIKKLLRLSKDGAATAEEAAAALAKAMQFAAQAGISLADIPADSDDDPGDKAVCPSCDHKGEYYNELPFVCESCEVVVDEEDQCHTPDCPCCATRPQCPECGSGMWSADTQAEYETGWPEPRASVLWHVPEQQPAPRENDENR